MKNVRIIAITKPENELDCNVDEFIAYVARISNPGNQNNKLTAKKLIKYLLKNKHFSPFEMVNVVFEINTTRDIGRQILRHNSCKFQEFSQRYSDITNIGLSEPKKARFTDHKNRQNSIIDDSQSMIIQEWIYKQREILNLVEKNYKWAIDNDIAKEVARVILPEGLTNSRLYVNGTLRSWIHYCQSRVSNGTQLEHSIIANEILEILTQKFPSISELEF